MWIMFIPLGMSTVQKTQVYALIGCEGQHTFTHNLHTDTDTDTHTHTHTHLRFCNIKLSKILKFKKQYFYFSI